MKKTNDQESSRRNFLLTATAAAAAGLTLGDGKLFAAASGAQSAAASPQTFKLYSAERLSEEWRALEKAPANKTIENTGTYSIILTVEKNHLSPEFEWHAGRDHILQVVDGETDYEVGGTPKNGHSTGPGEWLAPESEGATKMTLKKGDMLLIPRGTPHKRNTPGSVTLILISPMGVKA